MLLGQKVLVVQSAPGDARALSQFQGKQLGSFKLVQLGSLPKIGLAIPVADGGYVAKCWKLVFFWIETNTPGL